jgi:gamma-glutamyltranspeptidase / glutathione hydrolase
MLSVKACIVTFALVAWWGVYAQSTGQSQGSVRRTPVKGKSGRTMKTISRGTDYAVSSLMPQATLAAEHMIRVGGNAFDAIVAGEAVLGVVQPAANGLGSDAELLVYDAKAAKVYSINAEGTAPKLATIDWYKAHNGGKLPVDDGLLAGTVPGVVDAWYILLSRWGTKSFADVLAPPIELAERGVPIGGNLNSPALQRYPTTKRLFSPPDGKTWIDGQLWRNPDLARTLQRLVAAEKNAIPEGRLAALKAARDRFYKGDIAREMAKFSEENGGLFRYADFESYSAHVEVPVSINYRGYTIYKNPSATRRGHKVQMRPPWSMNDSGGIMIDYATGTVNAGADPRSQASSLAW